MRATLCLAIATPSNAMPLLCSATPCSALAELFNAMPSPSCSMLCLAVAMLCCALPCRCYALLRCAMPLHCLATLRHCYAALCLCTSKLCPALPLPCRQYADFLSTLARLPADLLRVKRLADRAFLHLADYVPPLDTVGHCVSPLSAPSGGACRVFTPLGM